MSYKYITKFTSPNQNSRNQSIKGITIHWWGNPIGQKIEGIVSWLCNPRAGTSAHYVVSEDIVYCIVDPDKRAWHAGNSNANHHQIGIELDPNASKRAGTMKTAAELIANLRKQYGDLPLSPHKRWTNTQCPGNYDLSALNALARNKTHTVGKPKPVKPAEDSKTNKLKVDGRLGHNTVKVLQEFLNKRGANLKVDGRLGHSTWKELQKYLGAPYADGIISRQSYRANELGKGITQGWDYTGRGSSGSQTVRLLQKWVKVEQDGIWFEGTTKGLQRKLNEHL